jgi:FAD/FMN-containing dehydrogenase/Fe-S oxidoreductase
VSRFFESELRRRIEGDVRFDAGSLAAYSTDASNYRRIPVGVICPRHVDDVMRAVALARENGVPLLARGGGTSLAGQTCNAALILDFSRYMTAIRSVDTENGQAVVEPGVIQSQLNNRLAPYGLFFPPDPATKDRCTLGGMIGNNSCGAHSAAYGKTADNVSALDVLLYDGTRLQLGRQTSAGAAGRETEIYAALRSLAGRYGDLVRERFPHIPRRVSGYNLDELLPENGFNLARAVVGSEGTLGLVLGATLKLAQRPQAVTLAVLGFADIYSAADQVPWILEHLPEALEAFDHNLVEFGREKGYSALRLLPEGSAFLIAELGGATAGEARARGDALLQEAWRSRGCIGTRLLIDPVECDTVWRLRESGLGTGAPRPGHPRCWPGAEDAAVPPARLGEYLRRFNQLLAARGLQVFMYYGHFGEGCVHCRINFDFASTKGVEAFRAAMVEIAALVGEFGGSISGEHGDGVARSELLPSIFGSGMIEAFREFKRIFDPDGRMNPGNIVDPNPLDANLRLGPQYRPRTVPAHFDFSEDGGLAGAASRCIGIGKCRKLEGGSMCPSYMVTRNELYSTRGRARLLFEALSDDGILPDGLNDRALYDALQFCLGCKACKSECPAAVDMALYKAEFLAHYHRAHRRPMTAQLFGRINEWAPLAARMPRLVNAVAHSWMGDWAKRLAGIHRERRLPEFARGTFKKWFAGHVTANPNGPEVLLFPDCFTNYFEPEVAIAGVCVLEQAGCRVTLPPQPLCCGRPLYEQGMLDLAKQRLRGVMQALGPYVERGVCVVGLEPGCILTFRDELPRLFPGESRARRLAENSLLLDEFLQREFPEFAPEVSAVNALFHGHCHQTAIAGIENEVALLRKIQGLQVQVLDAGCCGMAGAFGYAKDKYELSRALMQRVLAPAIAAGGSDMVVISDGFSCRSQIRHFCPGTTVLHLAQVLQRNPFPGHAGCGPGPQTLITGH